MCATSSKNDSDSVSWGEIKEQYTPFNAMYLWKPIKKFHTFTDKHKRNVDEDELTFCSHKSILESGDEEEYYDPVGSHIIELRKFHCQLQEHYELLREAQEKPESLTPVKKFKKQKLSIPEFPEHYPFKDTIGAASKNPKKILECKKGLSKSQIKMERKRFISRVLKQAGFFGTENDNMILGYLSDLLEVFLQKFINNLSYYKRSEPFTEDQDLWNPLETTLQNLGIGGIAALHSFYYENVAKKHDALLKKCIDLYEQVQKLNVHFHHQ